MPTKIDSSRLEQEQQQKKMLQAIICRACGKINPEAFYTANELHPGELNQMYLHDYGEDLCRSCRLRYPLALLKATFDTFDYALKLRTGEIFFFETATIDGDFVHLELHEVERRPGVELPVCSFDRGVDVRASDIVWCADAPFGS